MISVSWPMVPIILSFVFAQGQLYKTPPHRTIQTDRKMDVLKWQKGPQRQRRMIQQAGELLSGWTFFLADAQIDGPLLVSTAQKSPTEPFVRVVREELRRPIDVDDFIFFLDDVLRAGKDGLRGFRFRVSAQRARTAGILVHPEEIFQKRTRLYGKSRLRIYVDRLQLPVSLEEGPHNNLVGSFWSDYYQEPGEEIAKLKLLTEANPSSTFAQRVESLIKQLRDQGSLVRLESAVRSPKRGYLMWGAWTLSRQRGPKAVWREIRRLRRANRHWDLNLPIEWSHPKGWRATVRAAKMMAAALDVVFATPQGARNSKHYKGQAVDLIAVGLPRQANAHRS